MAGSQRWWKKLISTNATRFKHRERVEESRQSKVVSGAGKAKVSSLNVPMCIWYRHHLSCRSDENSSTGVSGGTTVNRGGENGGGE